MSNDLIWTTHAKERLRQRGLNESDVWATWRNPDHARRATTKDGWIYYKTFGNNKLEVVTKKNERGETLVISVWSRPVYGNYKKESFLRFLLRKIFR
jgi:hypothetical protein